MQDWIICIYLRCFKTTTGYVGNKERRAFGALDVVLLKCCAFLQLNASFHAPRCQHGQCLGPKKSHWGEGGEKFVPPTPGGCVSAL